MKKVRWFICGVYKVTSPNNKSYIGQSADIFARWGNLHKRSSGSNPLLDSFEKYGIENHSFEILEECKPEELHRKESEHKKSFIKENGWDSALFLKIEDDCPLTCERIPVRKYDLNGNFVEEFRSITEAAISVGGRTNSSLAKCCKKQQGYITYLGFQWRYADDKSKVGKVKRGRNYKPRIAFLLNEKGETIESFSSFNRAEKATDIAKGALSKAFYEKGNEFTYKGFKWLIAS